MAMSILGIVRDEAQKARASAVTRVRLCVGDLAGVEAATLASCFEMVREGTIAATAELTVKRIPATGTCQLCGATAGRQGRTLRCPKCKTGSVRLATGRELYVESIDVEKTQQG